MNLGGDVVWPIIPLFSSTFPYFALPTAPLAPPLVNVTPEGPTQLRASWVHAPGSRDGYQVTLYQAGAQAGVSTVGAEVDSLSFSALTPGTQYEVEIVSKAGPLRTAAANASGWTCEWGLERWAGLPLRPPDSFLDSP